MVIEQSAADSVTETRLALPGRRSGKVRDMYALPPGADGMPRVLMVATDRVSAFDVVMPTPIPGKGRMLTNISASWFGFLRGTGIVEDHVLSLEPPTDAGLGEPDLRMLRGRSMVCRAAQVIPIECVARGHLAGSGWSEYRSSGRACGVALPPGLRECERLPEPIFTPATKAAEGHDENIPFERACELVGTGLATRLRELTLAIYRAAAARALGRGLILADTKFEFGFALGADGRPTDRLMLVDEALTPDSSRYWPAEGFGPGRPQPSFDKQYLRDWLLAEEAAGRWDRMPPGPALPPEVVERTAAKYREAERMLTA
jgi:phosphoribosylaminoimidazole-succinocarboxamide synthase